MSPKTINKKPKTIDEILSVLNENFDEIEKRFWVKELELFSSDATGDQKKRDLVVSVEFQEGKETYANFLNLKHYIENILKMKIALIFKDVFGKEL